MKNFRKIFLSLVLAIIAKSALAVGWPANYEGVMLQAFYWDSYSDTRWFNLTQQADELCEYFDLIWIPNSGKSLGTNSMGYTPIYWFTNHNSSFGSENALINMIQQFKQRGTGVIADVVVNHRVGVNGWADFPSEEWNGKTYQLGLQHICRNDEINNAGNPGGATGGYDTGDNFDGARDLDHTNATVQDNVKNYCKCLIEKYGYTGFRLDMVKGYSPVYTKMYNQYAKPQFCVGEYWDDYDQITRWIQNTGYESAAFDFPAKYALNESLGGNGNLTKLAWPENGGAKQPAGLIHSTFKQYAVTFVDNHDTYRDNNNKYKGDVLAANAFILSSPGTPCVFLPHWKEFGDQIKLMIKARKEAGLSNTSTVTVLKTTTTCYIAEVRGSKHNLAVRIGNSTEVPAGYSSADLRCSGAKYAIWVKGAGNGNGGGNGGGNGSGDDQNVEMPANLYLLGNVNGAQWTTNNGVRMTKNGNTFVASNVDLVAAQGETKCFFNLTSGLASSWDNLNSSFDRFGSESEGAALSLNGISTMRKYTAGGESAGCQSWAINPGKYDFIANFKEMKIYALPAGGAGVENIQIDNNIQPEYYNLQGVRVDNPGPGLYIVRRGNSVTKEYVR